MNRKGQGDPVIRHLRRQSWKLGRWRIQGDEPIGRGGNGQVWKVGNETESGYVVKILANKSRERTERFKREVNFLVEHPNEAGILPIVDHYLAEGGSLSWFVMPEAVPLVNALGEDPAPDTIVVAVAEIATTLARLADQGVGHRDLKPDNLFYFQEKWCVGDFGLVTYPEVEPLTQQGRKVGPNDYIAPEMRMGPDTADFRAADVYSLAKTLWVLLSGQKLPLPGPHRVDDAMCSLTNILTYTWAHELDRLIARCTQNSPADRLSMREVAEELNHMLTAPPERSLTPNTTELEQRLIALTESSSLRADANREFHSSIAIGFAEVVDVIRDFGNDLGRRLTTFTPQTGDGNASIGTLTFEGKEFIRSESLDWTLLAPESSNVWISAVARLGIEDQAGRCLIYGASYVNTPSGGLGGVPVVVWEQIFETQIGSAGFKNTLKVFKLELENSLPELLAECARALEKEKTIRMRIAKSTDV